jgi:hypothetical protein
LQELLAADKVEAHQAPITQLTYVPERDEMASVAQENVAFVWDVRYPHRSVVRFQITAPGEITQVCPSLVHVAASLQLPSTVAQPTPGWKPLPLVAKRVRVQGGGKASTLQGCKVQVQWVAWRQQWLSMSDNGEFRLWSDDGELTLSFAYNGGSVQTAYIDEEHRLVLAAMADAQVRVFDLDDPVPKAKCVPTFFSFP